MGIGLIILVAIYSPFWHSGRVHIYTTYKAFTNAKLNATLGVKIGLKHINITLTNKDSNQFSLLSLIYEDDHEVDLNYNERFEFSDVSSMERELEHALYKGLPYPILKVIEYLSVDRAGFVWGRQYRLAGYYTFVILWKSFRLAFACWMLQFVMLVLVPHYFAKTGFLVGVVTLIGDLIYFLNTPSNLNIRYPAPGDKLAVLTFNPSYSFYLTFGADHILFENGRQLRYPQKDLIPQRMLCGNSLREQLILFEEVGVHDLQKLRISLDNLLLN
ncbi:hypothetical protein FO519_000548 [Halicephalobus sp. NKZ332]|nr:hypothetical protein FO519_000548 [Halicephalobus sp. NKZ332]